MKNDFVIGGIYKYISRGWFEVIFIASNISSSYIRYEKSVLIGIDGFAKSEYRKGKYKLYLKLQTDFAPATDIEILQLNTCILLDKYIEKEKLQLWK